MSYPGLANHGNSNLCFLNSVVQALASTTELREYFSKGGKGERRVISSLAALIEELNTPCQRPTVLRATPLIEALQATGTSASRLFNHAQQDAHELLIIILDAIEHELNSSNPHPRGLAALLHPQSLLHPLKRSPFQGLMANRIACAACGFSAGIRHSPTDHLSITLPFRSTCTLEESLKEYTILELLDDYVCRKCTLLNAQLELRRKVSSEKNRRSQRKRAETIEKKQLAAVSAAISEGQPDRELEPLVEQALRPPPRILTVHVSCSTVYGAGHLVKNPCRLVFPELLVLDPFTTTECLSARAETPISSPSALVSVNPSRGRTPIAYPYRLLAAVVHIGSHAGGHYLAFRRAPNALWYRLSDHDVDPCSVQEVLNSNPTLLFYQRLGDNP
ncbi:hypothetical protein VP01_1622g5 [Puccinia sorghi]|uniref:ubiquitinyl hydrolase 1 n=1 Tax=Puccinia sorghi TaxID=27349 RepID=A0A0L6VGZ9_9BASI|nr:hypothetical protein VP01_1622g5 [Puccinia sorghi]